MSSCSLGTHRNFGGKVANSCIPSALVCAAGNDHLNLLGIFLNLWLKFKLFACLQVALVKSLSGISAVAM